MIKRLWHGKIKVQDGDAYREYIHATGIRDYKSTPGNQFAAMYLQPEESITHVWTVSLWDDFNSIKAFAGESVEKAKYYDEDKKFLLEFEPEVYHVETVPDEKILQLFIDELTKLYSGKAWFGENFYLKLQDVSEAQAFTKPQPYIHSIAEILSHCLYWRSALVKRLEGDVNNKPSMKSEENWISNDALQKSGFTALYRKFEASQIQLVDMLLRSPATILNQDYASGYTFQYLIEGIIQHDIYHLGQIGLVKKIIQELG